MVSSPTLTRLDVHAGQTARLPTQVLDGVPNLLHLRLGIVYVNNSETLLNSLRCLPSLRSLSLDIRGYGRQYTYDSCLTDMVRGAPRLVALQMNVLDAPKAIDFIRTHREEELGGGFRIKPL
jgi:hypothetical protein